MGDVEQYEVLEHIRGVSDANQRCIISALQVH